MTEFLTASTLFFLAVANQIVLPAPIDLIMLELIKVGQNPTLVIAMVIVGSTIGAAIDYYIGKLGFTHVPWLKSQTKKKGYLRAKRFYNKYGYWTLLFSYIPFVGKYFPFLAGVMDTNLVIVLTLYILGKLAYYTTAWLVIFRILI